MMQHNLQPAVLLLGLFLISWGATAQSSEWVIPEGGSPEGAIFSNSFLNDFPNNNYSENSNLQGNNSGNGSIECVLSGGLSAEDEIKINLNQPICNIFYGEFRTAHLRQICRSEYQNPSWGGFFSHFVLVLP